MVIFKPRIEKYIIIRGDNIFSKVNKEFPPSGQLYHLSVLLRDCQTLSQYEAPHEKNAEAVLLCGSSHQDCPGAEAGFLWSQYFVGETGDFCIWKSMLSSEEIGLCIRIFTSNNLEWWALNYEMQIMCSPSSRSGTEVLLQQGKDSRTEIHWQESSGDSYTSCPMLVLISLNICPITWIPIWFTMKSRKIT